MGWIPSAIQEAVFSFANLFVQADVNRFGTAVIAGSTIAMNFEYFGYFFITAFGQTATIFTSQNFAAGRNDRCRRVLGLCLVCGAVSCGLLTVPLTVWHAGAASLFSGDPAVIEATGVRILWSFTVFAHFGTLESLYIVFPVSWLVTTALVWTAYLMVKPLKKAV